MSTDIHRAAAKRPLRPKRRQLKTTAGQLQALGLALLPAGIALLGVWHSGWPLTPGLAMTIVGIGLLAVTTFTPIQTDGSGHRPSTPVDREVEMPTKADIERAVEKVEEWRSE